MREGVHACFQKGKTLFSRGGAYGWAATFGGFAGLCVSRSVFRSRLYQQLAAPLACGWLLCRKRHLEAGNQAQPCAGVRAVAGAAPLQAEAGRLQQQQQNTCEGGFGSDTLILKRALNSPSWHRQHGRCQPCPGRPRVCGHRRR